MAFQVSPGIAYQVIAGETLIVDLAGSRILGLNATGALVFSLLKDHDEDGIARALCERYEIDHGTARREVLDLVHELAARGVVTVAG